MINFNGILLELKLGVLEIDMTYVSVCFVLKWQWNENKKKQ